MGKIINKLVKIRKAAYEYTKDSKDNELVTVLLAAKEAAKYLPEKESDGNKASRDVEEFEK